MNKFLVIAVCFLTANIVLTQDVPKTETPKTAVPAKTESEVPKKQVGIPLSHRLPKRKNIFL